MMILPFYRRPILMYHNVDERSRESKLSVSPFSFQKQMKFLCKHGIGAVPLTACISPDAGPLRKEVCITFDDGFLNNFEAAYPVLRQYNFPAAMFISTDHVGTKGYMSWDMLREMAAHNIQIGSHTKTHRWLPDLSREEIRSEIVDSKKIIEDKLGVAVDVFSYPMGGLTSEIVDSVKSAGYRVGCATNPPHGISPLNPYSLQRIKITRTSDYLVLFALKVSGYYSLMKHKR